MNFANYVDIAARNDPEKTALGDPTREVSYRELAAETDAVASGLADLGVEPGDRVALFLPNSVTFVTAYFGAMKRGAIPVPVNLRFGESEIAHVFRDTDPEALFTIGRFEDAVVDPDLGVEHAIVADGERGVDYERLLADADSQFDPHERKDTELAELLYTSGTTGRPKGVKHTHGNLAANARGALRYLEHTRRDTALTVVPCFHAAGLNITVTPLIVAGGEVRLLPEWESATALAAIETHGVTFTMFIPTMLFDLLEHGTENYDLSSLETVAVGGSPMPRERIDAAETALQATILEGYGMTETTPLAAVNRPGDSIRKAGSIGPPARDVVDVRIEDPETGEEVGTGEKGELLWHGDTVTPGYWNLPGKNADAFVERDGKEWFRSGDIGHVDDDGHLFVDDRIDDMIVTGGENVYPREIEDVIYELGGVAEVAVIGTPHDRLGELVTAIVRGEDVTAGEIESVCRDRLSDFKIPRRIHFVDQLPRTATRKIDKVALREKFGDETTTHPL